MSRLTRKINNSNNYCGYEVKNATYKELFELKSNKEIEFYVDCDLTLAIDKLGKIEDIEEELGCPLDVVFKALKTKVFTNAEDCYGQELSSGLREFEVRLNVKNMSLGLIHNSMFKGKEVIRHIPLKDYKKTWWLKETKEE